MQRPAGGGQGVDPAGDFRVFLQQRGMVRFDASVEDQRTPAAPMFFLGEGADAMDVAGRIGARECHPQKVAERLGDKLRIVDHHQPTKGVQGTHLLGFGTEPPDRCGDFRARLGAGTLRHIVVERRPQVIDRMTASGLALAWERKAVERTLEGKKIVLTGTLVELKRDEAKRLVEERGGRVTSSVSKNTSFVVVGDSPGSKADKAKELGVEILSEADFLDLVRG